MREEKLQQQETIYAQGQSELKRLQGQMTDVQKILESGESSGN